MFALLGVVECPSAISVSDHSLITVLPRKPVEGGSKPARPSRIRSPVPVRCPDTIVTLYVPRDETELEGVTGLVTAAHPLLTP